MSTTSPAATALAYQHSKGKTLYLNKRHTTSKAGKTNTFYFFAREVKDGVAELPEGYTIKESGPMAVLTKKKD